MMKLSLIYFLIPEAYLSLEDIFFLTFSFSDVMLHHYHYEFKNPREWDK